jgi:hypothetical protein
MGIEAGLPPIPYACCHDALTVLKMKLIAAALS